MRIHSTRSVPALALLATSVLTLSAPAGAQSGITYRFQENTLVGTVWVVGDDGRRELEAGENGLAAGRVEIWKDGGRQIFILNPVDRTYYELRAFHIRNGTPIVSAQTLTVPRPFAVNAVKDIAVDLKSLSMGESADGRPCRRAQLTFSYALDLRIERVGSPVPGRVEGTSDLCVAGGFEDVRLPFGHGPALISGHPQVDASIAKQLSSLKGIPVLRLLEVQRQIENGERVTATSVLRLSDVRRTEIAPDRFEIPADYRFREPTIVPPVRR